MKRLALLAAAVSLALASQSDLDSIKSEPKLERRAEKALDNAFDALKSAQESYLVKGDMAQTGSDLDELSQSVELAYTSLVDTGKNPSKSPKHFKRAEIKTRELLRRLNDFREQMSVDDRPAADKAHAVIQKVHEDLLEGIMGGKKKR
ncbi:MAG: hypothetical protein ACM336_05340 [Acidobacteriota bacterium]